MTNFSKCLYDAVDSANIASKDERIKRNMEQFSISVEDAIMLDNILIATGRTVCRVVGAEIDALPAHLQQYGVRMLPGSVGHNLLTMHDMLGAILRGLPLELIGMDSPTDGCDCVACKVKRSMANEIALVQEDHHG